MTKDQLITRFQLSNFSAMKHNFVSTRPVTASAVLIPLVIRDGQIHIILTQRSSHLRHHPSQISFPGGKADEQDMSLRETALRENFEELGIVEQQVTVFGSLPNLQTITGFDIKPYIGFVDANATFSPNPDEVAQVIELPLSQVLTSQAHFTLKVPRKRATHLVYFKPTAGWPIWGATAAIIEQLRIALH